MCMFKHLLQDLSKHSTVSQSMEPSIVGHLQSQDWTGGLTVALSKCTGKAVLVHIHRRVRLNIKENRS